MVQVVAAVMVVSALADPDDTRPVATARAATAVPHSRRLVPILIMLGAPFSPVLARTVLANKIEHVLLT